MFDAEQGRDQRKPVIVIGAGVGGLSAALRLQAEGFQVTVFDMHDWPGGKMRQVSSLAGPIDAGPTVLTMRHVFDDLFQATDANLGDYVKLVREPVLARHFWSDGSTLDLYDDQETNVAAIAKFAGSKEARAYTKFSEECAHLFEAFRAPMMESAEPSLLELTKAAMSNPKHLGNLSPHMTLRKALRKRFQDTRLVQLFGRYATYVGGLPSNAPALLMLIWHAEACGVWRVEGGMHKLAAALASRFTHMGGSLRLGELVTDIQVSDAQATGIKLANGSTLPADVIIHAGDPRALATGLLGPGPASVAQSTITSQRSLSARVWSFAAKVQSSRELAHHNVFFGTDESAEFEDLKKGEMPTEPTIYLCAEDRGSGMRRVEGPERFELILNAAPLTDAQPVEDEEEKCRQTTFETLMRFGLSFDPPPGPEALTTPKAFEQLFPGSAGSLYGQSPHGMTAALKRPRAKTEITGLYLAGGGTHPGAGVPMAALSGQHAAETIIQDHASILK